MNKVVRLLQESRPLVMGILNTTPDSFSDGGQYNRMDSATEHALAMVADGADIIDVGGESTRPGAQPVTAAEEIERVVPVIQAIRQHSSVAISVDSLKTEVMAAAIEAGAEMVNDVNALKAPGAMQLCARTGVAVCLMHMQGEPRTMQDQPQYQQVVEDIKYYLAERANACVQAGIPAVNIIIDPGFGFGKTLQHNLSLLKHLKQIHGLNYPVLVGLSRKSMFGKLLGLEVDQRLAASLAAAVLAYSNGAGIFRVHDVKPTLEVLKLCQAVGKAP